MVHQRTLRNSELIYAKDEDDYHTAKYDILYENIKFFYDILPVHLDVFECASHGKFMLDVTDELAREVLSFKREYEALQNKIRTEHGKMMPRATTMRAFILKITSQNEITRTSNELGWLFDVMDDLNTIITHFDRYQENIKDAFDAMICREWLHLIGRIFYIVWSKAVSCLRCSSAKRFVLKRW